MRDIGPTFADAGFVPNRRCARESELSKPIIKHVFFGWNSNLGAAFGFSNRRCSKEIAG
jgi:hypothetical protein